MSSQLFLSLIDEAKCYEILRQIRWPQGVQCPHCASHEFTCEYNEAPKMQYRCKACHGFWTDLTGTVFEHKKYPLKYWFYAWEQFRQGASAKHVAEELGVSRHAAERMRDCLQTTVREKQEREPLEGVTEVDEMYVNAGAKGEKKTPEQGEKRKDTDGSAPPPGQKRRGRGTAQSGRPPVFGVVERRSGRSHLEVRPRADRANCHGFIEEHVQEDSTVMTDEWKGYGKLGERGYTHRQVAHGKGEFARHEPGASETAHVNTAEALWSVARPWLRTFRGVRQDRLPRYLALFEVAREFHRRSLDVLHALLELVIVPDRTWTSRFAAAETG